ncbi:MAG: M23 family metallopeptidase [Myxococcales bacterium]|nr:M23 family metallopeptidase [Myxococcales bacterium]
MRNTGLALLALLAFVHCSSPAAEPPPAPPPVAAPEPPPPPPPALPSETEARLQTVFVEISGSLEGSLRQRLDADVAVPLSQVTARMLVWWVNVSKDLRKGDTLQIAYELPRGKEPLLHAVRFSSGKADRTWRAYRFQSAGQLFGRYFDESGTEIEETLKNGPIDAYEQITSILRDGRKHRGVDFKAPTGTPVKMPFDATLTRKNWKSRGNGNCLDFKDRSGRRIIFLHLDELPKDLKVGKLYRAGEVVAQSGNTGRSTAPHLHYQLETAHGKLLDPFEVHETFRRQLPDAERERFNAVIQRYDELLQMAAPLLENAPVAVPTDFD